MSKKKNFGLRVDPENFKAIECRAADYSKSIKRRKKISFYLTERQLIGN